MDYFHIRGSEALVAIFELNIKYHFSNIMKTKKSTKPLKPS